MDYKLEQLAKQPLKEAEIAVDVQAEYVGDNAICINHPLELFLIEYYEGDKEFVLSESMLHKKYQLLADRCLMEEEDYKRSEVLLKKGLLYNPADIELYEKLGRVFRLQGKWEELYRTALSLYPYCFTRRDLALFYRMLGCYHLEKYKPEAAEVLYAYSNLYFKTEQAEKELAYLEKALKRPMPSMTPAQIEEKVEALSYPPIPKKETLGMLYHTAMRLKETQVEYAKMLFISLYQLTKDENIGEIIDKMS